MKETNFPDTTTYAALLCHSIFTIPQGLMIVTFQAGTRGLKEVHLLRWPHLVR